MVVTLGNVDRTEIEGRIIPTATERKCATGMGARNTSRFGYSDRAPEIGDISASANGSSSLTRSVEKTISELGNTSTTTSSLELSGNYGERKNAKKGNESSCHTETTTGSDGVAKGTAKDLRRRAAGFPGGGTRGAIILIADHATQRSEA